MTKNNINEQEFSLSKQAVQEYLKTTNLSIQDLQAKKGDLVSVKYIGRFESGEVFDTNIAEVAKKSGLYSSWFDYTKTLDFVIWVGNVVLGFDEAVDGMKVWMTTTITLTPEQAYWKHISNLVFTIDRDTVQWGYQYELWQILTGETGKSMKVVNITKDKITFDANHPLAGKILIFDITLVEVK